MNKVNSCYGYNKEGIKHLLSPLQANSIDALQPVCLLSLFEAYQDEPKEWRTIETCITA